MADIRKKFLKFVFTNIIADCKWQQRLTVLRNFLLDLLDWPQTNAAVPFSVTVCDMRFFLCSHEVTYLQKGVITSQGESFWQKDHFFLSLTLIHNTDNSGYCGQSRDRELVS